MIDRNRKPRPRPRNRMAAIMSSVPLSLVEPDSIHIATMINRIPKGAVMCTERSKKIVREPT